MSSKQAVPPSATPGEIQALIASLEDTVFAATGQHVFRDGRDGSFTPAAGALAEQLQELTEPKELTAEERTQAVRHVRGVIQGYSENEMFDKVDAEDANNMALTIVSSLFRAG